jgi:hypothetical protein
MKELRSKIQELFTISRKPSNGWNEMKTKLKLQDALIKELETLARAQKTLVGRILKFPMADSYALYIITKELRANVHVQWLDYCDAWRDGRLGDSGNVDINYARACAQFDDYLNDMVEVKKYQIIPEQKPIDLSKSMF